MAEPGILQELVSRAAQHKIAIICIQEHRFLHTNFDFESKSVESYQLITSSAYRDRQGSTIGGIDMLPGLPKPLIT